MRKLGRFREMLPFTHLCFCIGSLAIMGFPFLTGFYSKDVLLEAAFVTNSNIALFTYVMGLITAVLTAFYSLRLHVQPFSH